MGASVSMCAEHYVVRHISEEFTRLDKDNKGYLTLSHVMRDDSDACFRPPPRAEIDLKCIPSLYFLDQTKSGMFHKSDFMSLFQTCLAWQRTFRPDMEEKELVLDPAAFLTFKFCRDCEHLGTTHFAKWFCRLLAEGTPFTEHEGQLQLTRTHVLTLYKLLQIDKTTSTTADGLFLLLHETGSELVCFSFVCLFCLFWLVWFCFRALQNLNLASLSLLTHSLMSLSLRSIPNKVSPNYFLFLMVVIVVFLLF
eukprot:c10556_g1_i3.p1 GENE.c10556_g1_i3~~c10556_g1_i3.p1  ORF type:complete len:252 (+),score=50.38 c10556_g1_i3:29-784(+)